MTRFFNNFEMKNMFGPFGILFILGVKNWWVLSRTITNEFQGPYKNLEKTNDPIPRKTYSQNGGRKDEQTLFYWTLPATAGGRIIYLRKYVNKILNT